MKNFSKIVFASLIASTILSTPVFAQTAGTEDPDHPRINQVDNRIEHQEQKVNAEEASGKITPAQAARDDKHLNNVQNRLDNDAAKNGGHITKGEQRRLNKSLNKNNQRIHHQRKVDGTAK